MKTISTFVIAFFVFSSILMGLPHSGNAGLDMMPIEMGCQQLLLEDGTDSCCDIVNGIFCAIPAGSEVIGEFEGQTCNEQTGLCSGFKPTSNVPTMSQYGLIATAGVLGIIGFMVIRRRKVAA